jgi:hypothetical protein
MQTRSPFRGPRTIGLPLLVTLLGITQIVGYGTLYYAFGILAPDLAGALGWRISSAFAAF